MVEIEDADKDRIIKGPGVDPLVETAINITMEEEEVIIITIEITGPTTEVEICQEMGMEMGEIMDKTIEEIIMDRIMVTKGIETEVKVKTVVDLGKRYRSNSWDRSNSRNRYSNNSRDQSKGRQGSNSNDRDNNMTRSRSCSHVSTNRDRLRCYRCSEYDHFARECPNALTDDSTDESEGCTLQMLTEDETSVLDYSEMELDGDLNM